MISELTQAARAVGESIAVEKYEHRLKKMTAPGDRVVARFERDLTMLTLKAAAEAAELEHDARVNATLGLIAILSNEMAQIIGVAVSPKDRSQFVAEIFAHIVLKSKEE